MTDFHATEKIIGGAVVLGVGSLLMWSVFQGGDAGFPGMFFGAMSVFGAISVIVGLFELIVDRRWVGQSEEVHLVEPEGTAH